MLVDDIVVVGGIAAAFPPEFPAALAPAFLSRSSSTSADSFSSTLRLAPMERKQRKSTRHLIILNE